MTIAAPPEFSGFLSPGTRLHEYAVERVLGHGGFGITYLATDTNLQKRVAIKEYLPTDLAFRAQDTTVRMRSDAEREAFQWGLEQFVKEARTLARFAHPAVIQIHRYFESNGTAYFVMEYAEGETLGALLRRQGVLPADALQKALLPILDGLQEVHRAGVLHRDIKPENIILRRDGSPVLIDFGAARLTLGSKTRSVLTMATAGYAPLEQYSTTGAQGPWTDIYALGAVAYRALSGRKPVESINRLREDPLVPAALAGQGRYPPAFLAAVDWALAVNHEDRPQNLAEWRLCLTGAIAPPARADAPAAPQLPAAPYVAPAAAPPQPASAAVEATE
ncbi:MAG: serine/threonine protein kinase, partial [Gammaproteobacteria bacterium]|nr:serine/threonine protein kinase [Gammaproteobacteria bacterium]